VIALVERLTARDRKCNNGSEMGHPGNRRTTRRTVISPSQVL
jgi:hypothetical protein